MKNTKGTILWKVLGVLSLLFFCGMYSCKLRPESGTTKHTAANVANTSALIRLSSIDIMPRGSPICRYTALKLT
jgi:hypothetical protein